MSGSSHVCAFLINIIIIENKEIERISGIVKMKKISLLWYKRIMHAKIAKYS